MVKDEGPLASRRPFSTARDRPAPVSSHQLRFEYYSLGTGSLCVVPCVPVPSQSAKHVN